MNSFCLTIKLLENTLRANLSIFTTDYSDLQLLIAEPSRVGPYTANAGEATIEGFELELAYAAPSEFFIDMPSITDRNRYSYASLAFARAARISAHNVISLSFPFVCSLLFFH